MKLAVIGAGAVGGYFGGRLVLGGNAVVFLARGKTLRALQREPLRVESINGDFEARVCATDKGEEIGTVSVVLVAVKTWQVNEVAAAIRPMLGRGSIVVPFQNGVDAPAQLAAVLGADHVVGGLCKILASAVAPGHIRHISAEPFIVFGEIDRSRSDHRLEKVRDTFAAAGIGCEIARDIVAAMWEKFLFVTPCGSLGAVTRLPVGEIRTNRTLRAQLIEAMQEIVKIADARGINLPGDVVRKAMDVIDMLPKDSTFSMQRDIMGGRPSELEAQTGAVVRLGREVAVSTPLHASFYETLLPLERCVRDLAS
jgi:2-dehydropantoate 2-reductase